MALPQPALEAAYGFFGEELFRNILAGKPIDTIELGVVAGRIGLFLKEKSDLFKPAIEKDIQTIEEMGMRLFFPDAAPEQLMGLIKDTLEERAIR